MERRLHCSSCATVPPPLMTALRGLPAARALRQAHLLSMMRQRRRRWRCGTAPHAFLSSRAALLLPASPMRRMMDLGSQSGLWCESGTVCKRQQLHEFLVIRGQCMLSRRNTQPKFFLSCLHCVLFPPVRCQYVCRCVYIVPLLAWLEHTFSCVCVCVLFGCAFSSGNCNCWQHAPCTVTLHTRASQFVVGLVSVRSPLEGLCALCTRPSPSW